MVMGIGTTLALSRGTTLAQPRRMADGTSRALASSITKRAGRDQERGPDTFVRYSTIIGIALIAAGQVSMIDVGFLLL
jgi:hypothetical protein